MRSQTLTHRRERGFSMVEMLMAAFILAIGLLGLAMLQTLSIRTKTSSGALTTAVQLAECAMDQVETTGRNSILWVRNGTVPAAAMTQVFTQPSPGVQYTSDGVRFPNAAGDPAFFNVFVGPAGTADSVAPQAGGWSGLVNMQVLVRWTDSTNAAGAGVPRQFILRRRVMYATTL